jgi:ferric-dicitrate binding protein FerR (iron transport regulator)
MEDVKYTNLIGKYLSGNMSSPEKKELMSWVESDASNQDFLDDMIGVWGKTGEAEPSFEANIDAAWAKVDQRLPSVESEQPVGAKVRSIGSGRRRLLQIAAAAVLVLMAGWWWSIDKPNDVWLAIDTMDGAVKMVNLPDGSEIWLNANSRLSYPESFTKRQIRLEGEAFFDVARMEDSPFEIYSGEAKTTVLGTSFNVRAYPEEEVIEISVTSGKVTFEEKNGEQKVTLVKNNSAIFKKKENTIVKVEEPISNVTSWKTNEFDFSKLAVGEMLDIFERHFGVRFENVDPRLTDLNLRLKNEPAENLPQLLEIIKFAAPFEVEFDTTRMKTDKIIVVK